MDTGDVITAVGILISAGLAIFAVSRTTALGTTQQELAREQNLLAEEQNKLLAEQNEIARRQLEADVQISLPAHTEAPNATAGQSAEAAFRVSLSEGDKARRLVVLNVGMSPAYAVRLDIHPDGDLVGGSGQTFPRIDPGQEWRLLFDRSPGSPGKYYWTLTWTAAPDGEQPRTETGTLSSG